MSWSYLTITKSHTRSLRAPRSRSRRGRDPWSVPRLRGRGEQGDVPMPTPSLSALCIARTKDLSRDPKLQVPHLQGLAPASRAANNRVKHDRRNYVRLSPCSPGPRKRGNAPRLKAAFSLVEVLASLFILTVSAIGITAAWRLADYQELLTRVDRRAERILRQYYELQTFAPADSRPFTENSSSSTQNAITGYLYHPRLIASQAGSNQFGNLIPFSISMTNGITPGKNQLVLTYTVSSYGTQASRQVTKTVILNP